MSSLRIEIQRHQFLNKQGQNVVIDCQANNRAAWIVGTVDTAWIDVTEDVDGLDKIDFEIRQDDQKEKMSESASTGRLTFTGNAATLIQDWLFDTPCSYINYFNARIIDKASGVVYSGYELKADYAKTCQDDGCYYTMILREGEDKYRALKKLSIHDNWQKWFSEDGTKNHPTFQVVIQQEPIAVGMKVAPILFFTSIPVIGYLISNIIDKDKEVKRALGFGRYHAAPRIYDIILNACMKVGLSTSTPFDPSKELYNDCLFIPYSGIYHTNYDDNPEDRPSPSTKHIWNNRYIWQFDEFLDELCRVYDMKWDIVDGALVMHFESDTIAQDPVYTASTYDSVCKEFDLTKKPAFGRYEYTVDGGDTASNQVSILYNDIVDYDGIGENPMLEGSVTKQLKFAPTAFYCDSLGFNYIEECTKMMKVGALAILATLVLTTASLTVGVLSGGAALALAAAVVGFTGNIIATANKYRNRYRDTTFAGIIRLQGSGTVSVPRIIRYDPSTPMANARPVKTDVSAITINPRYNTDNVPYATAYSGTGFYRTIDRVYNYPLMFDANYNGNLYDRHHEAIDNPMVVNLGHQTITIQSELCGDLIKIVGVGKEGDTIVGKIVKVSEKESMYVTEATINYAEGIITMKGKILLT